MLPVFGLQVWFSIECLSHTTHVVPTCCSITAAQLWELDQMVAWLFVNGEEGNVKACLVFMCAASVATPWLCSLNACVTDPLRGCLEKSRGKRPNVLRCPDGSWVNDLGCGSGGC